MAAPIFDARYVFMNTLDQSIDPDVPLLAARAGLYCERRAEGTLGRLFRCVWTHWLPGDFQGRAVVVPDGCSDLIFAGGKLLLIGPDRIAAFPQLESGETVLGLRLRPGAALRWLDTPLCEFVGQAVTLADLRRDVTEIEERLRQTPDTATRMDLLHAWARHEAEAATEAHHQMDALFTCLLDGRIDADLQSTLGERTLRRRANDHFGYGPKTLNRVLRLQRLLRIFEHPRNESLAVSALEAGYSDQAHMTRDVRELTTLTPLDIRRQLLS